MSQYIISEVTFFLHSFLLGIVITMAYDGFLILRRLVNHNLLLISLEDMLFWIACAIGVFYMLYEENNGILRWFAVFAATLGMILYKKTVSAHIINIMSTVIGKIFQILFRICRFLVRPIKLIGKKTSGFFSILAIKTKKVWKYVKIRLTKGLKLLKMTLCKH